jgi:hypothetical protein
MPHAHGGLCPRRPMPSRTSSFARKAIANIIKIKKDCNMRTVGKVISWFFFIYFFVMLGTFLFLYYKENKRYQLYAIVSFIFKGSRVETHAGAHDIDPQFETYGSKCRTCWGINTPGRLLFILT